MADSWLGSTQLLIIYIYIYIEVGVDVRFYMFTVVHSAVIFMLMIFPGLWPLFNSKLQSGI
jgi:hypothetical protein